MRHYLLLVAMGFLIQNANAQSLHFSKYFLTSGYSDMRGICIDPSGGFMVTGLDKSGSDPKGDLYAMKISALGEVVWHRNFGLKDEDGGNHILALRDSNFLITGHTNNIGEECDAYIKKIDRNGDEIWTAFSGEPEFDEVAFAAVEDASGDLYTVGRTDGQGTQLFDFYLTKISKSGSIIFNAPLGSAKNDVALKCNLTSDNNIIIAGYTADSVNQNVEDIYFVKCTKDGVKLWDKTIASIGADILYDCKERNGRYYFFGSYASLDLGKQALIICTDMNGNFLWQKNYGGEGDEVFNVGIEEANGDWTCIGTSNSYGDASNDFYKIVIAENGDTKSMDIIASKGPDYCWTAIATTDKGYGIVGKSNINMTNDIAHLTQINEYANLNIGNLSNEKVYIYPNPFLDEVVFSFTEAGRKKNIQFYNVAGQLIHTRETTEQVCVFQRQEIGHGILYYQIIDIASNVAIHGVLNAQ